jgi:hypothetical protein
MGAPHFHAAVNIMYLGRDVKEYENCLVEMVNDILTTEKVDINYVHAK